MRSISGSSSLSSDSASSVTSSSPSSRSSISGSSAASSKRLSPPVFFSSSFSSNGNSRSMFPPVPPVFPRCSSQHPELEARGLVHAARIPRRVPDDVHVDVGNAGYLLHPLIHLARQRLRRGAARGGERHTDHHGAGLLDFDLVDESELVNIHRDLGIEDVTQRLDHLGLDHHRVGCRIGHEYHSVETASLFSWSAACSACQASVAHFTRVGNSHTPEKTTSLPKSSASPAFPITRSRKRLKIDSTSWTDLPLRLSVITDAEAFEIAQPEPSKLRSCTRPSSTRT